MGMPIIIRKLWRRKLAFRSRTPRFFPFCQAVEPRLWGLQEIYQAIVKCLGRKEISTGADDPGDQRLAAEEELAVGLPVNAIDKLIEGLEGLAKWGIRYPIPDSRALADMPVGLPKIYKEMFKVRLRRKT